MEKNVKVIILTGHESRPEAMLVQIASRYISSIYIIYGDKTVNAKSIMGMLSLKVFNGMEFTIKAEGEDAEEAVSAMVDYLTGKQDN